MLDQIKIASPCSADWEQMEGNDRVRFCGECKKNVFNLSAMTRRDAEALLKETNGNLCTRSYRRADGTVLTEDCPVGLRVKAGRLQRRIGWAIAGMFSLATAWGQENPAPLSGVISDSNRGHLPNSRVTAVNLKSGKKISATTDKSGQFRFNGLEPGQYDVQVTAMGFRNQTERNITVGPEERKLQIVLQFGTTVMGRIAMADLESVLNQAKPSKLDDPPANSKPWWRRLL